MTNATTIKQWAILDSRGTSHFLTTDALVTNILPAAAPLIARLPNDDKVQPTHTYTLDLPDLLSTARAAHIIPGWHHTHSSPSSQCATMDAWLHSLKSTAPSYSMAAQSCVATSAPALACGWCLSPRLPKTKLQAQFLPPNPPLHLPPMMMPHP
jgi:hypothetical protein